MGRAREACDVDLCCVCISSIGGVRREVPGEDGDRRDGTHLGDLGREHGYDGYPAFAQVGCVFLA